MEIIIGVLLLATWAFAYWLYLSAPDRIPAHFNALGEVDRWGDKSEVFMLCGFMTVMVVVVLLLAHAPSSFFNYPVKVNEYNIRRQHQIAVLMVRAVAACLVLIMDASLLVMGSAIVGISQAAAFRVMMLMLVAMFVVIGGFIFWAWWER